MIADPINCVSYNSVTEIVTEKVNESRLMSNISGDMIVELFPS